MSAKQSKKEHSMSTNVPYHQSSSHITDPDAVYEQLASSGSTDATASASVGRKDRRTQGLSTKAKAALLVVFAIVIGGIGFMAGLQTGKNSKTTATGGGRMGNFGSNSSGYGSQMGPPSGTGNGQMPSGGFPGQSGSSSDSSTTTPQTTTN